MCIDNLVYTVKSLVLTRVTNWKLRFLCVFEYEMVQSEFKSNFPNKSYMYIKEEKYVYLTFYLVAHSDLDCRVVSKKDFQLTY